MNVSDMRTTESNDFVRRNLGKVVGLALLSLLCSCSKHNPKGVTLVNPPSSAMANSIHFQYAVYLLPTTSSHNLNALTALRDALEKFPEMKLVDEIPEQPQGMYISARLERHAREKYAPPSMKSLRYSGRGLTASQARELQECKEALLLDFSHPKKYVWAGLRAANAIMDELVQKTGGFAWDDETREVFSAKEWHDRRIGSWVGETPDVSNETVIHIYDNERSVRAITLGMSKMGLPDVTMNSSTWSSENQMGNLMNIFSQCLAEGQAIREAGDFKLDLHTVKNSHVRDHHFRSIKGKGIGVACLSVTPGQWEEGDPKNRLIYLGSNKYPGPDADAKQESMISSFFGSEDAISKINHTEELLAASAKAKAELPDLQKAFAATLQPGEYIDVKAPFATPGGGREWMWVDVTKWKGDDIEGILENDPEEAPGLRAGQRVNVRQQDVFDYMHHFDNRTEGNTTGEIIKKMTESEGGPKPITGSITLPECDD